MALWPDDPVSQLPRIAGSMGLCPHRVPARCPLPVARRHSHIAHVVGQIRANRPCLPGLARKGPIHGYQNGVTIIQRQSVLLWVISITG